MVQPCVWIDGSRKGPDIDSRHSRVWFDHHLVDEAPLPVLPRFEGSNDGMMGPSEVLCRVFVFRGVAAADVTASQAESQMDPRVAHPNALLASSGVGRHVS